MRAILRSLRTSAPALTLCACCVSCGGHSTDGSGGTVTSPLASASSPAIRRGESYRGSSERFNRYYTDSSWQATRTIYVSSDFQVNADPGMCCSDEGIAFDDPRCDGSARDGLGQGVSGFMLIENNYFHNGLAQGANFTSTRNSIVRNNIFAFYARHGVSCWQETDNPRLGSSNNSVHHNQSRRHHPEHGLQEQLLHRRLDGGAHCGERRVAALGFRSCLVRELPVLFSSALMIPALLSKSTIQPHSSLRNERNDSSFPT
jgi:hypothetical protein